MSARDENVNSSNVPSRPYRSHKFPACNFCRRRKSRCIQQSLDQPCTECIMHRVACSRTVSGEANNSTTVKQSRKRRRVSSRGPVSRHRQLSVSRDSTPAEASAGGQLNAQSPFASNDASKTQSTHIVGPEMARDAHVLERFLSPAHNPASSRVRSNPYRVYSNDPRDPVVYMKVPRHRNIVPSGNGTTGFRQFEAMDKIVEPLGPELFRIYFDNIHPAFPILDEKTIVEAYSQDGLPYTLICEIYAMSLILWKTSKAISATGRLVPDIRYMWNLAVSAMNDDFVAPDMSTVLSCILDLLGRPTTSITYNAVNVGRVVALAQSLGLNRNPKNWDLDARQKHLHIRTWWAILIHDQWASLSHGTPPHIHCSQWDVPVPDSDTLSMNSFTDEARIQGALSFVALCQLTLIMSEILPLIYTLKQQDSDHVFRALRRHEMALDEWEEKLPVWLQPGSSSFDRKAAGALNIKLCYLVIKMCLWRNGLREVHQSSTPESQDEKSYYQSRCRKAARAVIDFVTSLDNFELDAFWLPYSAYHFASATTLILRCAIEAETPETAQECVASAKTLIDFLRKTKDEFNWDLADACLTHCEVVTETLSNKQNLANLRKTPTSHQQPSGRHSRDTLFSRPDQFPEGQAGTSSYQSSHVISNGESAFDEDRGQIHGLVMDPIYFQDFLAFGSMPGMMADNAVFPDTVSAPFQEGYSYRNFLS